MDSRRPPAGARVRVARPRADWRAEARLVGGALVVGISVSILANLLIRNNGDRRSAREGGWRGRVSQDRPRRRTGTIHRETSLREQLYSTLSRAIKRRSAVNRYPERERGGRCPHL